MAQCSGPDAETQVWSGKLAEKAALPQAGQSVVAHFLATQGTWMQKAAFNRREGLTSHARERMLRNVTEKEAVRLLRLNGQPDLSDLSVSVDTHGPSTDFVLLCCPYPQRHDHAARIAAGLLADQAIAVARRWPPNVMMPTNVHAALIDAMLADVPPRGFDEGPDEEENRRICEAQQRAELEWESHLWELLETLPQVWRALVERDSIAGRHVQ
jgi:hypothetical protein